MARSVEKYGTVEFKQVAGGMVVPTHPYPTQFLISNAMFDFNCIEVRKATVRGVLVAILKNWITDLWFMALKSSWKVGFLDPQEGVSLDWAGIRAAWRWKWWTKRRHYGPKGTL